MYANSYSTKIVKRIGGTGTGWLDGKSRLEQVGLKLTLKVDNLSTEQICAGSELQADGAETENALEEKLQISSDAGRFGEKICVLEEHKALGGR